MKTIKTEFFTTISWSHFWVSLSYLTIKLPFLNCWKNRRLLEDKLKNYLDLEESVVISFYSWRTAIFECLKLIGIKKNDEVIVNAYTCVSVVNAIIQAWGTPVYVDIREDNLSFDSKLLEKNINSKTRLIILQHTFGKTWTLKVLDIASKNDILVLEDVAHSLGSMINDKKHWTFGDFAVFSTGRDKVISWVSGGLLIVNNEKYFKNATKIRQRLLAPPIKLVFKNHLYNIIASLSNSTYDFLSFWKILMYLARKLSLINEIVTSCEKSLSFQDLFYSMPNSLAKLALNDFKKIDEYNKNRRIIAKIYDEKLRKDLFELAIKEDKNEVLNYFRYPIIFKDKDILEKFYNYMRKNKVILWDSWSFINIAPKGTNLKLAKYDFSAPIAEKLSNNILFLANSKNINSNDLDRIILLINNFKL